MLSFFHFIKNGLKQLLLQLSFFKSLLKFRNLLWVVICKSWRRGRRRQPETINPQIELTTRPDFILLALISFFSVGYPLKKQEMEYAFRVIFLWKKKS